MDRRETMGLEEREGMQREGDTSEPTSRSGSPFLLPSPAFLIAGLSKLIISRSRAIQSVRFELADSNNRRLGRIEG